MTDEAILLELRDINVRLLTLICAVSDNIEERERRVKEIIEAAKAESMDDAEWAAGFRGHEAALEKMADEAIREVRGRPAPNDHPVAIPCATHQFAPGPCDATCWGDDDPPSREP